MSLTQQFADRSDATANFSERARLETGIEFRSGIYILADALDWPCRLWKRHSDTAYEAFT
jgi:hypothetical protein